MLRSHFLWLRHGRALAFTGYGLAFLLFLIWLQYPLWDDSVRWPDHFPWCLLSASLGVLLGGVALWVAHGRQSDRFARTLDARFNAFNRIEASTEFHGEESPIFREQRRETASFLATRPVRRESHLVGLLAVLLTVTLAAYLATILIWARPWERPARPRNPLPRVDFSWRIPRSEIKALPDERVALEARVESECPLASPALEIEVNGEPRGRLELQGDLKKPGAHTLQATLDLATLRVRPYDIVSYHLSARRLLPWRFFMSRRMAGVVSCPQFVQVKKPEKAGSPKQAGGSSPQREGASPQNEGGISVPAEVKAIKISQLSLIKQNHLLSHSELDRSDPSWEKENLRVLLLQRSLSKRAKKLIGLLAKDKDAPKELTPILREYSEKTLAASCHIETLRNKEALREQSAALALIASAEQFLPQQKQSSSKDENKQQDRKGRKPDEEDPFKDPPPAAPMEGRAGTQAGVLEKLARQQEELSQTLFRESAATQSQVSARALAEQQARILRDLDELVRQGAIPGGAAPHAGNALGKAKEAQRQLDANRPQDALEPATVASGELREAVNAMRDEGEKQAALEFSKAAEGLAKAAEDARKAAEQNDPGQARAKAEEASRKAAETADNLSKAAQKQQRSGSKAAAGRLHSLSAEVSSKGLAGVLRELREKPQESERAQRAANMLKNLADRASRQQSAGGITPEEMAALAAQMEHLKQNMGRLEAMRQKQDRERNGSRGSSRMQEQLARELLQELGQSMRQAAAAMPGAAPLRKLEEAMRDTGANYDEMAKTFDTVRLPMEELIAVLRAESRFRMRKHRLEETAEDPPPPAYRPAVEEYFERLSRDYRAAGNTPAEELKP